MHVGSQNSKSVNKIKGVNNTTEINNKDKLSKSVISYNNNLVIKEIILFCCERIFQQIHFWNQDVSAGGKINAFLDHYNVPKKSVPCPDRKIESTPSLAYKFN